MPAKLNAPSSPTVDEFSMSVAWFMLFAAAASERFCSSVIGFGGVASSALGRRLLHGVLHILQKVFAGVIGHGRLQKHLGKPRRRVRVSTNHMSRNRAADNSR